MSRCRRAEWGDRLLISVVVVGLVATAAIIVPRSVRAGVFDNNMGTAAVPSLPGTVGTVKTTTIDLRCPGDEMMSGIRVMDRITSGGGAGILVDVDIICADVSVDATGAIVVTRDSNAISTASYDQGDGSVDTTYCPAGQVIVQVSGVMVSNTNLWPDQLRFKCRTPRWETDASGRTGRIRFQADSLSAERNVGNDTQAGTTVHGPFCGSQSTTNDDNRYVSGLKLNTGGEGYDGVGVYCSLLDNDFGDAPASYGSASHEGNAGTYLGARLDVDSANFGNGTDASLAALDDDNEPAGVVNIAAEGTVTSSPTFYTDNRCPNSECRPVNAVDGQILGNWIPLSNGTNSMFSTAVAAGVQHSWSDNFGEDVTIEQIVIYNRTDCCADRLNGATVRILDGGGATVWSTVLGTAGTSVTLNPGGVVGRRVDILGGAIGTILNFTEVQIFASGIQDDEDGVAQPLPSATLTDTSYSLTANATHRSGGTGRVTAWVDFDRNGTFDADELQTQTVANLFSGDVTLTWPNADALMTGGAGTTFARVRVGLERNMSSLLPGGAQNGGEVEDYPLTLLPPPDVSVVKTGGAATVNVGDNLTYTLAVANATAAAAGVVVTDFLPSNVSFVSSTGSCTAAGQTLTCPVGAMAAGATTSINVTVVVNGPTGAPTLPGGITPITCAADQFLNVARVTSTTPELVTTNNVSQLCTRVGAKVRAVKVSNGAVGTFNFASTNLTGTIGSVTTTVAGTPADGAALPVTDRSADVTLTETVPATWTLASATCIDRNAALTGNSGTFGTLAGATLTVPSARLVAGADIACTFTDDKAATLRVTKAAVGGPGTFDFDVRNGAGVVSAFSLSPTTGTPSVTQTVAAPPLNTPLVITEYLSANPNFELALANCVNNAGGASGSTFATSTVGTATTEGTATVTLAPGADVTCSFVNVLDPEVVVIKTTNSNESATFDYTLTTSAAGTTINPSAPSLTTSGGTANESAFVSGLSPGGPTQTDVTVTEADPGPAGYQLGSIECRVVATNTPTGTPDIGTRSVLIPGVQAGNVVACNFTNSRRPRITIRKVSTGSTAPFTFTGGTNGLPATLTLDTTGGNPSTSTPFIVTDVTQPASLTETVPPGWVLQSAVCTDSTATPLATTLVGSTLTIPASTLAAGVDLTCTFTNAAPVIDVAKTAGGVESGTFASGVYEVGSTITVTNSGGAPGTYNVADLPTAPAGMAVTAVTISPVSGNATGTPANGSTSASITGEAIAAGATETWHVLVEYTITDPTLVRGGDGTCNEATGLGGFANQVTGDSSPANNLACVDVPDATATIAGKTITATAGTPGSVVYAAVGDQIEYEFDVTNTGNTLIYDMAVTDAGADAGSIVLSDDGDGDLVMAPGETWMFTAVHTVVQADIDAGSYTNTALVIGYGDPDGDGVGNSPAAQVVHATATADQQPRLELTKRDGAITDTGGDGFAGNDGDTISYTFEVRNTGNLAITAVTVTDPVAEVVGGPIDLAPGDSDTATFTATLVIDADDDEAGSVVNQATATGVATGGAGVTDLSDDPDDPTDADLDGDGEPDDPTVTPLPAPDLAVTKTTSTTTALIGQPLTYRITATNEAAGLAPDVVVTDYLPDNVTFSGATVAIGSGTCTLAGAEVRCDVGSLAAGASVAIDVTVVPDDVAGAPNPPPGAPPVTCGAGTIANVAGAASSKVDADPDDDWAEACVTLGATVTVSKRSIGGIGTFTFAGTNLAGPIADVATTAAGVTVTGDPVGVAATGTDVTITETVPAGWALSTSTCTDANSAQTGNGGIVSTLDGATVTVPGSAVVPGADLRCSFVDRRDARLTVAKVGIGGAGSFDFELDDGTTIDPFTLSPAADDTDAELFDGAPIGAPITISELDDPDPRWVLVGIHCTDNPGGALGSAMTSDVTNGVGVSGTADVTLVAGADVTCTFVNVLDPKVVIVKSTVGGDGAFTYDVTTSAPGTTVDPATPTLITIGGTAATNSIVSGLGGGGPASTDVAVAEQQPDGFELTELACTDLTTGDPVGAVDVGARTATLAGTVPGDQVACAFTNTRLPNVTILKESVDGTATFDFADGTNGVGPAFTLDTSVTNPAASATFEVASVTQPASIREVVPAGWTLLGVTCLDPQGGLVASTLTGDTLTIAPAQLALGVDITCTFRDAQPVIELVKTAGSIVAGTHADGFYEVEYTVEATNAGLAAGPYSFADTPVAPSGMTVTSVVASTTDPAVTTTPDNQATTATVTAEPIEPGATETWTITVRYEIADPSALIAGPGTCDEAAGVGGFANLITGDADTTDNAACVDVPAAAAITVVKTAVSVDGDTTLPLVVTALGQVVGYTVELANTGNVPVTSATVDDALADSTPAYESGDDGDSLFEPGEIWVFTATRTADVASLDSGQVVNVATGSGSADTDGDGNGDQALIVNDGETVPVEQAPSIAIGKAGVIDDVDGNGRADAGDEIDYTFTVTNTGNVTLDGVTVTDTGLPGVAVVGAPVSVTPGASTTFTATYVLTQHDVDAGQVVNQASASGDDPSGATVTDALSDDPATPAPDDPTVVVIPAVAELTLTKTGTLDDGGDGRADAGDQIDYRFTVTNTGNVTIDAITIDDTGLPGVTVAGGPVTLAPGDADPTTFTATYALTQADVDAGQVVNQASVTGDDPSGAAVTDDSDDPGTPAADDPTVVPLPAEPELTLTKAGVFDDVGGNGRADAGDEVDYAFTVTNTGNVTIDAIEVDDVSLPGIVVTGGPLELAPGASDSTAFSATYVLTQADVDAGQVANQASVTGDDPTGAAVTDPQSDDPSTPAADDPTVVPLPAAAELVLTKTGVFDDVNGNGRADADDEIEYSFTVTNAGNVTLDDVAIDDSGLPGVVVAGGPVTLAPGAADSTTFTATYVLTQADVDAGQVANQAIVTGSTPGDATVFDQSDDPATGALDDPTVVPLPAAPGLTLAKSGVLDDGGDGRADAGDAIDYSFTIMNTGNVTLDAITVDDTGLSGVTVVGGPVTLAPGASDAVTFTATYVLTQADVDAGQVVNQATVTGDDPSGAAVTDLASDDPSTGDPDDPTVVLLPEQAVVALEKSGVFDDVDGNGRADAGDEIEYSFTITNDGNVTLTALTVADTGLPGVTVSGGPVALAPGASDSTTFSATYVLTQADVDAGQVVNQASAAGETPAGSFAGDESSDDPATPDPDDPTVVALPSDAELVLEKTGTLDDGGDGRADAGDEVGYSFTVTNTGNVTIDAITVDDSGLPGVVASGGPVTLAPGASDSTTFTATYVLTQADVDAGEVVNQATVTGDDPSGAAVVDAASDDPATPDPDDPTVVALPSDAELVLEKSGVLDDGGDGRADAGDEVGYSFTVTNTGNVTIDAITLDDSGLPGVVVSGGPVTLAPGASDATTFTATYVLTQADVDAGEVVNQATVTGDDPSGAAVADESDDPATPDPDDPTVVVLAAAPALALLKTGVLDDGGDGRADAGDEVGYSFTVTNTGNVTVDAITVDDSGLPGVVVSGGPVTLAPGASDSTTFTATYVLTQADVDAGEVVNQATVTGDDPSGAAVADESDDPATLPLDDPTVVALAAAPRLELEKSGVFDDVDGNGRADAGDEIDYSFTVTNTGNVTVDAITVDDTGLPGVTVAGGPVTLAPGATDTTAFTATYVLTQADIDAGEVVNQASVTGDDPSGAAVADAESDDPATADPNDPTVVPLPSAAELILEKSGVFDDVDGNGRADAGDEIDYSFTVANTGNVTVDAITVDDTGLPGVTVAGGPVTLAPAATDTTAFTATYVLTQADVDAGEVVNQASVTGDDPSGAAVTDAESDDPATADPNDPTVVLLAEAPALALTKSGDFDDVDGNGRADAGDEIAYSFTVTNTGNVTVDAITVDDTGLPGVTVAGGPITLAPGASDATTFTATYVLTQADVDAAQVTNQAAVAGESPAGTAVTDAESDDPSTPALDDPTVVPLAAEPEVELTKLATPQTYAAAGDEITYTYTVTNTGNVSLAGPFVVADDHIDSADIDCSAGPATLAPGASFDCTGSYTITAGDVTAGSVTNVATVTGGDPGGAAVTSEAVDETVSADLRADLETDKVVTDASTTHVPGSTLSYTITVTNAGPSLTTTTSVDDTLPPGTTLVSAVPSTGTCPVAPAGTVHCDLGPIAPGGSSVVTVVVTIDPASTGALLNGATASSDLPDPDPSDDSDSVATTSAPEADVWVDKQAPATFVPGTPVTYTLVAGNDGPSTATGVVTTDTLPGGVTFDAAASSAGCAESGGVVTCDPITLAPGATSTFTISVTTASSATAALTNTAAVSSAIPDPDPSDNDDSTVTTAAPIADLVTVKSGPTTPIAAGEGFGYSITVSNAGPSDAAGVTVDDVLPAGLALVSASVTGGAGTETCDTAITCDLGTVTAGATETITIAVDSLPSASGTLVNTATAATATDQSDTTNDADDHAVTIEERTDVALTKTASADPVVAGTALTYTLRATNAGPSQATGVVVTDLLPAGLTFVSAPGCAYDAPTRTLTCATATLAVGVPVTYSVSVTVDADVADGTLITNTAVAAVASDTNTSNNAAGATVAVDASADLVLAKLSDPPAFVPGQPLEYVVSVLNAGPSDALDVVISDTLPAGFAPTGVTPAECVLAGQQVTCTFASVASGAAVTVNVFGQTSPSATTLVNTATVASTTPDPDTTNNAATNINTGTAIADLSVVKSDSIDPVQAGAPLTYTITVTNNGPSDAASVTVADTFPAGFTPTGVDRSECTVGPDLACTFLVLGAGLSEQIVVTGTTDSGITDTGDPLTPELSNTVSVSTVTIDPVPANDTSTATTDVVESADVVLTKLGQGGPIVPGEPATFAVDVVNAGPSDADGVVVTDTLPDGLTFVSATGAACAPGGDPQVVTCALGTLPAGGAPVAIVLTVDTADSLPPGVVNSASVSADTPDPELANNSDVSEDPSDPRADLEIAKTDLADPVIAGTEASYDLTVRNTGPSAAADATIVDTLPPGTTLVSAEFQVGTGTCSPSAADEVTCIVTGGLPAGAVASIRIVLAVAASVPDGTVLTNSAVVSSTTPDPDPADNAVDETTTVGTSADVGVTKVGAADPVTPGESISYSIHVRNNGPSDAQDVTVTDTLPPGLENVVIGGATCAGSPVFTCDLGTLAPAAEVVITVAADIDPAVTTSLLNTAGVTTTTNDPNAANDAATTATPVAPEADLEVVKTGPATVVAGTAATYTVRVVNAGPSDALDVVITDTAPAGTTITGVRVGTGTGTCTATDCTFPSVPVGTFASMVVDVTIDASVPDGTVLTDTGAVTSTTPDPDPGDDSDDVASTVSAAADLTIVKQVSLDPFVPGQPLTYTVTVVNNGPSDAVSVTLDDPIPVGLTITGITPDTGTCEETGAPATVGCDLGTLPVGSTAIVTITTGTDPAIASTVSNTATLGTPTTDPAPGDESSTVTTDPAPTADLQVTKTAAPTTAVAGTNVTYTVTLTNAGPSTAASYELADQLPIDLAHVSHTVVSGGASCAYEAPARTVRCTGAALAPSATVVVEIVATVAAGYTAPTLANTAGVTSPVPDPDPSDNAGTATIGVTTSADVSIVKTLVSPALVPGLDARYRLAVTNSGPSAAQAVTVTDTVPAGLAVLGATTTFGACSTTTTSVDCGLGTLTPSATVTILVDVHVDEATLGDVTNTAVVTTTTTDPDPADDSSTTVDPAEPRADLVVTKQALATPLVPGEDVEYLITVANAGPSDAFGVVLDDPMPGALVALTATPDQGTCDVTANSISCDLETIAEGGSAQVTVSARVTSTTVGPVTNAATATATPPDPDESNNTGSVTSAVEPHAGLTLTKVVSSGPIVPGRPVTYTIVVGNTGPSSAHDVVVSDPMPIGLTPTGASSTIGSCSIAGQVVTCTIGTVAVGAAATVTIVADTSASLTGTVSNSATATTSSAPDPGGSETSVTDSSPSAPSADLSLTKTAPESVVAGAEIRYVLTVANAGPSHAAGVVVTDVLPPGTTFVRASAGCVHAAVTVTCTAGTVAAAASLALEVVVTADDVTVTASIVNTAQVAATTPDPDAGDRSATATTLVTPRMGRLSGSIWNDTDGDGVRDPGEPGIAGVEVIVSGDPDGDGVPDEFTATTGADGSYTIDLPPGVWTITLVPSTIPPGMSPTNGPVGPVTVGPGTTVVLATGLASGTLTGRVWLDVDRDGQMDPGEGDLSGVRVVFVSSGADGVLGNGDDRQFSAITASPFVITGVPQPTGSLTIDRSTLPAGMIQTSDPDGVLDASTLVTRVAPGGVLEYDFGFTYPATAPVIPTTGSDPSRTLALATTLVLFGAFLILLDHRRRHPRRAWSARR